MPVYEFNCNACGARVSVFTRSVTSEVNGKCDRCGSTELTRAITKFAVLRAPFKIDKFDKRELMDGVNFTNPTSMANFFRKMGDTFQDEQNDYMDEIIGRLDHGERVQDALGIDDHTGHNHGPVDSVGGEGGSEE